MAVTTQQVGSYRGSGEVFLADEPWGRKVDYELSAHRSTISDDGTLIGSRRQYRGRLSGCDLQELFVHQRASLKLPDGSYIDIEILDESGGFVSRDAPYRKD